MTHPIIPFNFESNSVRMVMLKNEPWFVAADVCRVLGHTNSRAALRVLDDDEKGVTKVYTLGGEQEMNIISESGLFALILRSNKPKAKKIRKWVTSEVLPTVRKTGKYQIGGKQSPNFTDPLTHREWLALVRETRLAHGKTASQVIFNRSPFSDLLQSGHAPQLNDERLANLTDDKFTQIGCKITLRDQRALQALRDAQTCASSSKTSNKIRYLADIPKEDIDDIIAKLSAFGLLIQNAFHRKKWRLTDFGERVLFRIHHNNKLAS